MSRVGVIASRWFLSALLIVGAGLFLVGVAAERSNGHTETPGSAASATTAPATHVEGSGSEESETATTSAIEPAGHTETPGHVETGASSESNEGHVLGVNLESNGVVAVGLIISLTLAVLAWRHSKMLLIAVVAFAVAFAIFDIAEVAHQANASHSGVAVLAALVAVAHFAAAAVAVVLLVSRPWIVSPAGAAT